MLAAAIAAILLLALFVVIPGRRRRPPTVEMVPTGALFMEHHVAGTVAELMKFEGEPPQPALFVHYVPAGTRTLPPGSRERDETPDVLAVYSLPYGERAGWAARAATEKAPAPPAMREEAAIPGTKEGSGSPMGTEEPSARSIPKRSSRTAPTPEPSVGFEAWVPPAADKPVVTAAKKKTQ
jgi:hypothetical protein